MNDLDWKQIRNFNKSENWGDPQLLVFDFIHMVDQYRSFLGYRMVVSSGTQGEHGQSSLHPSGRAADFVFPELTPVRLFDCFLAATRFEFTGIGIYPHWKSDGRVCGGIHLERRDLSQMLEPERKRYWMGVPQGTEQR